MLDFIVNPNRTSYCQYLLSTQINYTLTNFAAHKEKMSHDSIKRYLEGERITASDVWKQVRGDIVPTQGGFVVFDDTILDKNHSHKIELVRRQYSGNAHGLVKGIGVVNCVYVNPELNLYWVIDYRIFNPDCDGKTKLDHVHDMILNLVYHKKLPMSAILMDTWYAVKALMLLIESLNLVYYCPMKSNRLVGDSEEKLGYEAVSKLAWSDAELQQGKRVKLKGFPKIHRVKLFRIEVSTHRTDFIVTNDLSQNSTLETGKICAQRWKVEQFHREIKQLTGVEKCQCRKAKIQRNHIACAYLVWTAIAKIARQLSKSLYQIKHEPLTEYLSQQLKQPTFKINFA